MLLLATAGIVVSMMMPTIVQTAHASCISSPKGDVACSGGCSVLGPSTNACSISSAGTGGVAESGPSGSGSVGPLSQLHTSFSHNFLGNGNCADSTCSGNK